MTQRKQPKITTMSILRLDMTPVVSEWRLTLRCAGLDYTAKAVTADHRPAVYVPIVRTPGGRPLTTGPRFTALREHAKEAIRQAISGRA